MPVFHRRDTSPHQPVFIQTAKRIPGGVIAQTLVATAAFAGLAMIWPGLRYSGSAELHDALGTSVTLGATALALLAILKIIAMNLCLSAGWRGGIIFPLITSGATIGYASASLFGTDPIIAAAAGMSAATATGMGKPIAAGLILIFMVNTAMAIPISIGCILAWIGNRYLPSPSAH